MQQASGKQSSVNELLGHSGHRGKFLTLAVIHEFMGNSRMKLIYEMRHETSHRGETVMEKCAIYLYFNVITIWIDIKTYMTWLDLSRAFYTQQKTTSSSSGGIQRVCGRFEFVSKLQRQPVGGLCLLWLILQTCAPEDLLTLSVGEKLRLQKFKCLKYLPDRHSRESSGVTTCKRVMLLPLLCSPVLLFYIEPATGSFDVWIW